MAEKSRVLMVTFTPSLNMLSFDRVRDYDDDIKEKDCAHYKNATQEQIDMARRVCLDEALRNDGEFHQDGAWWGYMSNEYMREWTLDDVPDGYERSSSNDDDSAAYYDAEDYELHYYNESAAERWQLGEGMSDQ